MLKFAILLSIAAFIVCEEEVIPNVDSYKFLKNEETFPQPPHIIFIFADDLGWNDVSFHGSPQIPTPNIDTLAASGIVLNNYYTENLCTPSRAALMTGKYPIHTGLQHFVIKSGEPTALPLDLKTLPEHLKKKGYVNHMVGKWHLGHFQKKYTPTKRGFDTFYGFYNGKIDYYDYTNFDKHDDFIGSAFYGIDLQEGTNVITTFRGQYATEVFTEKSVKIIENHNNSVPLFLYLSHFAPHLGNEFLPLQAPESYVRNMNHIKDMKRRVFGGMISALDTSVGKIVQALFQRGFLQNSIIVFTSDNGAETESVGHDSKGSNWPLRGQKVSYFEGGIRVPCLLWSPLLKLKEPRTSNQLMHVTDWLPTLYSVAGGQLSDLGEVDGSNTWEALKYNLPSPRKEILHNIDSLTGMYGLRKGDYKLIVSSLAGLSYQWPGPTGFEDMPVPMSMDDWVFKNGSIVKSILQQSNLWLLKTKDIWRMGLSLRCNEQTEEDSDMCNMGVSACLFNIAEDPCEQRNIANQYPDLVQSMMQDIKKYNATAVEPLSTDRDPHGDPRCHGFTYVPWKDEEFISSCPSF